MNKSTFIKRFVLAIFAFLPCVGFAEIPPSATPSSPAAQSSGTNHDHVFDPERQLHRLITILGLSDVQQGQIRPLLISRANQLSAIYGNATLPEEQKSQQVKAVRKSTLQQIERYLSSDQLARFKALHNQKP